MFDPLLIALASGGAYIIVDSYLERKRKRKRLPKLLHAFDIALEDDIIDINNILEKSKVKLSHVKTAAQGYLPQTYLSLIQALPVVIPGAFAVLAADYLMDKRRKRSAKRRLERVEREFDSLLDEALMISELKYNIKSSSLVSYPFIKSAAEEYTNPLFATVDKIMTSIIGAFTPGLTHGDIVRTYTYTIVPYAAFTSYKAAKEIYDTKDKTRDALLRFFRTRTISTPALATIPAMQSAIINKYKIEGIRAEKEQKQQKPDYRRKQLEALFKRDIASNPEMTSEYKNRQTIEDIFNEVKANKPTLE